MKINEIVEGIKLQPMSNQLRFNYNLDNYGVSTKMGKGINFTPYIKKGKSLDGYTVYSVYSSSDVMTTDVIRALKKHKRSQIPVSDTDYNHFIKRTAIFITSKILAPNNVDIMITPKSSSNILNDLLKEIQVRQPHILFYPESFVKVPDISKIEINRKDPRITPEIIKSLESQIRAAVELNHFEIKKISSQHRKFLKNFYNVFDPAIYKKLQNKNICVLDDTISSGTTLLDILRKISDYNPANVFGVTIYKSSTP